MITEHTARVNVMWDILQGCVWNCAGCHVDKKSTPQPSDAALQKLSVFLDSMKTNGYVPDIVTLGPVDSAVADNTLSVLTESKTANIIKKFNRIALPSRMLNEANALVHILNTHYSDMEIEFQMVIDVPHFGKDTYLEKMRERMEWFKTNLKHTTQKYYPIFNLYDYINSKTGPMQHYEEINQRCVKYFNFGADYAFSFSRLDTLSKADVERLFSSLKVVFDKHVTTETAEYIHFAAGHAGDSSMITVSQAAEGLYLVPVVYEHYVTYRDAFKIADWTFEGTERILERLHMQALSSKAVSNGPCGSCSFMGVCLNRMSLAWMDEHGIEKCVMPTKAYEVMN